MDRKSKKVKVTWQEVPCVWLRGNQRSVSLPRVDAGCYDIISCRYNEDVIAKCGVDIGY